jgi:hypothetical protein
MPTTELKTLELTSEEWELIGDLLRREVRNLPIEIHHTDIRAARVTLHQYLDKAESLLAKITPVLEG